MIDSIKAFGDVKKSHTGYLVFVIILKPNINDSMRTSLHGMAFEVCRLVGSDKRMLFQICDELVSH